MRLRPFVAIVAAVLLVGVPSATLDRSAGAQTTGPPAAPLTAYAAAVPASASVVPLGAETPLLLTFTLGFSNASRLQQALAEVGDRSSPEYRHFLTYAQFQREFAPAPSAFATVEAVLRSAGATAVAKTPGGTSIDAVLPATAVQQLLGVRLVSVVGPKGSLGYTSIGPATLPSALSGQVVAVDGLSRLVGGPAVTPIAVPSEAPTGSQGSSSFVQDAATGDQWFIGTDYAQAYGATDLLPGNTSVTGATYPTGVAIATLLASGYNTSTATSLPPWDPAVVDAYYNETFPAGWPLPALTGVPVTIDSSTPLAPGPSGGQGDVLNFEVENSLDLEMAGSLAPGAHLYNFYFNGALLENPFDQGSVDQYFATDLGTALNYTHYGYAKLAVISCSFGLPDVVNGQWDALLEEASMMGVTIVSATGDQGNSPAGINGRGEGPDPLWPAAAAFNTSGAVAVGGVSLSLSGKATSVYTAPPIAATYDQHVAGIASAEAWSQGAGTPGNYAGTEGGIATAYSEPPWQFHSAAQWPIVNATEVQGAGSLGRAEPDVALSANSTIIYVSGPSASETEFEIVGGTSVAAPVFAGLLADIVAVENATLPSGRTGLGFLDPELYRIASYFRANPGSGNPFADVITGHNYLFQAGAGWDPLTGWGEVSAPLLLLADEDSTIADYVYTGPTPTLPPSAHPLFSSVVVVLALFAGAAAAVLAAAYILLSSRRVPRQVRPYDPTGVYAPTPPGWATAPYPASPPATFACPYCGIERPAEPGHCPNCGAM